MRYVPYGVGAFMLTPLLVWAGLWVFAFEGPKTGFEDPVTVAMIGVSLPVVVWFGLRGLSGIAGIAGRSQGGGVAAALVAATLRALPIVGIGLTAIAVAALMAVDVRGVPVVAVAAAGLACAGAIWRGERSGVAGAGKGAWARWFGRLNDQDALLLLANPVLLTILAVFWWGLPALIVAALVATPVVFVGLILVAR